MPCFPDIYLHRKSDKLITDREKHMESSEEQDPLNGAINGEVQVSSETVKVQKLPMREYAEKCEEGQVRRSSNPTQEKLVASFENFFYW